MPSLKGGGAASTRNCAAPPPPRPHRQRREPADPDYAQRSSTVRCISRSHIVWNSCSRSPITAARFSAHRLSNGRMRREVRPQRLARKRDDLGFERRGRGEREAIRRDQRRPSDGLSGDTLLNEMSSSRPRTCIGSVRRTRPRWTTNSALRRVAEVEQFRAARKRAGACPSAKHRLSPGPALRP